jgi:hypothetical protein
VARGVEGRDGKRRGSQLVARAELDEAQQVTPVLGKGRHELVPGCRERLGEGVLDALLGVSAGHLSRELHCAADPVRVETREKAAYGSRACVSRGRGTQMQLVTGHARAQCSEQRGRTRSVLRAS